MHRVAVLTVKYRHTRVGRKGKKISHIICHENFLRSLPSATKSDDRRRYQLLKSLVDECFYQAGNLANGS